MMPKIITRAEREAILSQREGLGTKLKHVIHASLDAVPMPEHIREQIKNCSGCKKRERAINIAQTKVKEFFGFEIKPNKSEKQ